MERPVFVDNEIYHVFSRGVEKRNIFTSDKDRFRFIHDVFEFNDEAPARNTGYFYNLTNNPLKSDFNRKPRSLLVEVLCFCFMPSHYHLLLR